MHGFDSHCGHVVVWVGKAIQTWSGSSMWPNVTACSGHSPRLHAISASGTVKGEGCRRYGCLNSDSGAPWSVVLNKSFLDLILLSLKRPRSTRLIFLYRVLLEIRTTTFLFHNLFCCHLRLHSGFHTSSLLQSYHKCFIPVFLRLSLDYHQYCGAIVAASGSLLVCLSRSAWSKSGLAACSIFFDMLIPLVSQAHWTPAKKISKALYTALTKKISDCLR